MKRFLLSFLLVPSFCFSFSYEQKEELKLKVSKLQSKDIRHWKEIISGRMSESFEGEMIFLEGRWMTYFAIYDLIQELPNE